MNDTKKKWNLSRLKSKMTPYWFISPATLTIVCLVVYPILYGIYISFFDTNLVNKWNFVGLRYYAQALTDASFLHSLILSTVVADGFVGTYVGMYVSGGDAHADFDWFRYEIVEE